MIEHFVPNNSETDDSDYHKQIGQSTSGLINTQEFTQQKIRNILEEMDPNKVPGVDCILLQVFKLFPKFVTAVYNFCLIEGIFLEQWKSAIII